MLIEFVGILVLLRGDKLYYKFVLVDDDIVIIGFYNWFFVVNYNNDEMVLVL